MERSGSYASPATLRTTGLFEIFHGRNVRLCRTGLIFHHHGGVPVFYGASGPDPGGPHDP